ncbi:hypothetical protein LTR36_010526 [Oleoguttula mirabilis]|uniref:ribonuclease H n=1 Tax=Oleoguttula mirabilis TaxID=1507867 RepID=A0AAV9J468_9PEZI|nr:hypothetical protein LTR36_010526 [Oleoguttula mirabilis]
MSCYCHTDFSCSHRTRRFGDRLFNYIDYGVQVETTWAEEWWTLVTCPEEVCDNHHGESDAHIDSVIIAVDGACRNNGGPGARAAAGIFFHRDNDQWNQAILIDDKNPTSQRAELVAAREALALAIRLRHLNPSYSRRSVYRRKGPTRRLRRVVIKSDSAYVVNAMTDWIDTWKQNGFRNCRGLPVANESLFRSIDEHIKTLNGIDVEVQFWHVPRGQNEEADLLANAALGGKTAAEALSRNAGSTNQSYDDSDSDY